MAESKRAYVFNEAWNFGGGVGVGDVGTDTFIANVFAPTGFNFGSSDTHYTGNEILNPLAVLRLTVRVNWLTLSQAYTPALPTIRLTAYLVAINDELATTTVPRLTSPAEDELIFVKHPGQDMRWQINSQNVTVIKKKSMVLMPKNISIPGGAISVEQRVFKLSKKLRGKKQFEERIQFDAAGTQTQRVYLKGWNYYWMVTSQLSNTTTAAQVTNGLYISGDRYLYYKDF